MATFTWAQIAEMKTNGLTGKQIAETVMYPGADPIRGSDLARKAALMVFEGKGDEVYQYKGKAKPAIPGLTPVIQTPAAATITAPDSNPAPKAKAPKAGKIVGLNAIGDALIQAALTAGLVKLGMTLDQASAKAAFEEREAEMLPLLSALLTQEQIAAAKEWAGVRTEEERRKALAESLVNEIQNLALIQKALESHWLALIQAGWKGVERPLFNSVANRLFRTRYQELVVNRKEAGDCEWLLAVAKALQGGDAHTLAWHFPLIVREEMAEIVWTPDPVDSEFPTPPAYEAPVIEESPAPVIEAAAIEAPAPAKPRKRNQAAA